MNILVSLINAPKCSLQTTDDISWVKLGIIPKSSFLLLANDAKMHPYDLLGFCHQELNIRVGQKLRLKI